MSKSAIVRGASKAASIWSKIDAAVKAKGGSKNALDILDREEGAPIVDVIADILVKAELKTRTRFPVTVDYTKSLAHMVAEGKYNRANDNIVANNFPIEGTGIVETEIFLVNFDRDIEFDEAIKEIKQMGLQPAKIEHLLALGAEHPYLQKEYPIICLGSSWVDPDGDCDVPCLDSWNDERELNLDWFDNGCRSVCCFAAIRPPSPKATEGQSKS